MGAGFNLIMHSLTYSLSNLLAYIHIRTIRKKVMQSRADNDDPERDAIARRLEDAADKRAAESEKAVLLSYISEGDELEQSELLGISGQISKRAPPARKSVQVLAFASAKANESTFSASATTNESTISASTNANESTVSNSPAQHGHHQDRLRLKLRNQRDLITRSKHQVQTRAASNAARASSSKRVISNVSKSASHHNTGSSMAKHSYLPKSKQPTRKTSLSNKSAKSQQVKRKT